MRRSQEAKFFACGGLKRQKFSPEAASNSKICCLRRAQNPQFFACAGLRRQFFFARDGYKSRQFSSKYAGLLLRFDWKKWPFLRCRLEKNPSFRDLLFFSGSITPRWGHPICKVSPISAARVSKGPKSTKNPIETTKTPRKFAGRNDF